MKIHEQNLSGFAGSSTIDFDELKTVLKACMEESSLKIQEDDLEYLTAALFEEADSDNSGEITFEEFYGELEKHPGVLENMTIRFVLIPTATEIVMINVPSLKLKGFLLGTFNILGY